MYCPECGATTSHARTPGGVPKCPNGCKITDSVPMSPEIARKRKERANQGPVIKPHYNILMNAIAKAADDGKDSIILHHALNNHDTRTSLKQLDHLGTKALVKKLQADGWTVTEHPDPDPGDPRGGAYTTVSGW